MDRKKQAVRLAGPSDGRDKETSEVQKKRKRLTSSIIRLPIRWIRSLNCPSGFSGCIIPPMASAEQQPESLNIQLLVDSIPALIHTARPDGNLDYFNKPWLEYLGVTLNKVTGWNWTAFVHPEDVEGIVAEWRTAR